MYTTDQVIEHCYGTLGEWLQGWTHPSEDDVDFQCRIVQESKDVFRYEPHPLYADPEATVKKFRIYIDVEEIED